MKKECFEKTSEFSTSHWTIVNSLEHARDFVKKEKMNAADLEVLTRVIILHCYDHEA